MIVNSDLELFQEKKTGGGGATKTCGGDSTTAPLRGGLHIVLRGTLKKLHP